MTSARWLRHEVPMNMAGEDRISVSFDCEWGVRGKVPHACPITATIAQFC